VSTEISIGFGPKLELFCISTILKQHIATMVNPKCTRQILLVVAAILMGDATVSGSGNLRGRAERVPSTDRATAARQRRKKAPRKTATELIDEEAVKKRFEDLITKLGEVHVDPAFPEESEYDDDGDDAGGDGTYISTMSYY